MLLAIGLALVGLWVVLARNDKMPDFMSNKKQAIDSYIRRQRFRKALAFVVVTVLFAGFMSYALYMEYG